MSSPKTTSLLSLPNELLVIIFENPKFPVDYLCLLAVLCRRLHFLALPIYFARSGMPAPSKTAVVTLRNDGMDMLAALQMALFVSSIEDVTCIFPHPSCTSIFPLLPHVRRFHTFISRFPSVKSVTLQLDTRNSMCNAVGDDAALRAWSSTLGGLLNSLVDRRCTELTVRYGGYLTQSYTLSAGSPIASGRQRKRVKRALKALKKIFRARAAMAGKGWEFRRAPDQGREGGLTSLASAPSRSRKLTSLHIQSAVLVTPPCLNWTLSALRHCPITSLTLSQISLDQQVWSASLTLIAKAGPQLTDISLSELENISAVEIFALCARLPQLTTLNIGTNDEARGTPTRYRSGHPPEFRALARLTAPADFILYCLRPRQCFPKLTSLCISFPGQADIRVVGARLSVVCKAMAARSVSPSVTLSLSLFPDSTSLDLEAFPRLPADLRKCFAYVAGLDLQVFPYDTGAIARWIHLFPYVQHVELTVRSKPGDAGADAQKFVRAITKAQSLVRTVTINGCKQTLYDDLPLYSANGKAQ